MSDELRDQVAACLDLLDEEGPEALERFLVGHAREAELRERLAILSETGLVAPAAGPGTGIPGYELRHPLGAGGMGEVWAATRQKDGRAVALKMLRGDRLPSERLARRLQHEAACVARLEHPVIVPVIDSGLSSYGPWFAMPEIVGVSLDQLLAMMPRSRSGERLLAEAMADCEATPLDLEAELFRVAFPDAAAMIAAEVAAALEVAHRAGILHRDIKPSNLIVTPRGEVRLIDFGLARDEEQSRITATESPLGSLAYMPPEQRAGSRDLDASADVHALGATLHEMLTGAPPRAKESGERGSWPDAALAPHGLDAIVAACTRPDPRHRYRSAADLGADLRRVLRREEPRPPRVPLGHRMRQGIRRHPFAAVGIAVLLAAVVVAAIALEREASRGDEQARDDVAQRLELGRRLHEIDRRLLQGEVPDRERREVVKAVIEVYGDMLERDAAEIPDEILEHAATAFGTLGRIQIKRGEFQEAGWAVGEGLRLYAEFTTRQPVKGSTFAEYAGLLRIAGTRELDLGRPAEARRFYQASYEAFERARPLLHESKLELCDRRRAGVILDLANLARIEGRFEDRMRLYEEGRMIAASHPALIHMVLQISGFQINALQDAGREEEARALEDRTFADMRASLDDPEIHFSDEERSRVLSILAQSRRFDGDVEKRPEIIAIHEEIVALRRRIAGADVQNVYAKHQLAVALTNLGSATAHDEPDRAKPVLAEALALEDEILSLPDTASDFLGTRILTLNALGVVFRDREPERAADYYTRAIDDLVRLIEYQPARADLRGRHAGMLQNRAAAWRAMDLPRRSVEDMVAALAPRLESLELQSANARLRAEFEDLVGAIVSEVRELGAADLARRAGELLVRRRGDDPEDLVRAAQLFLAAPGEDDATRARAVDAALGALRAALAAGLENPSGLRSRPGLQALDGDPRFARLMAP
ncbi:MAG: serine/threonine-protein kinase [Planctomycetota bacterium]